MFVHVDAKALEWYGAVYLSQDKVGLKELWDNLDAHALNQERFKLPTRLIAKTFLFRLIYGGSAYAYVKDNQFNHVSKNPKFWQKVIDEAYEKYSGLKETHDAWVSQAVATGKVVVCTGREYSFAPIRDDSGEVRRERDGSIKWPRTTILNYPVQGLGNDLMAIVRTLLYAYMKRSTLKHALLVCTVHDSIDVDCPPEEVDEVIRLIKLAFENAPARFKTLFGVEFNLPLRCEIFTGLNLKDLTLIP